MKKTFMEIGEAVKLVRKKRKLSQNALAAKMDTYYDSTNMSRFERGDQGISQDKLSNIADILGVSVSILYAIAETNGKLLEDRPETLESEKVTVVHSAGGWDNNVHAGPPIRARLPVINSVQAGRWTNIRQEVIDETTEWVETTAKVSPISFGLRVEGDSMTNPNNKFSIPEGAIVVVDPEQEAQNGTVVVFRRKGEDEATLKQLKKDGGKQYLKPLNPQYPMLELDDNCVLIGKCIEVIIKLP